MPVGLDDALDIKLFAEIQEQFMFISSIDKKAFSGLLATDYKNVIIHWPYDNFMNLQFGIFKM